MRVSTLAMASAALRAGVASPRSAEQLFEYVDRATAIVLAHGIVIKIGDVTIMTKESWLESTTACATTRRSSTPSWRRQQDVSPAVEQPSQRPWRRYSEQQQRKRDAPRPALVRWKPHRRRLSGALPLPGTKRRLLQPPRGGLAVGVLGLPPHPDELHRRRRKEERRLGAR